MPTVGQMSSFNTLRFCRLLILPFPMKEHMKKVLFLLLTSGLLSAAQAQAYWQQQVDVKIDASLNDKVHAVKGSETIDYTNNSPDKLDFIWFHLWPNAYKDTTTAFARQVMADKDGAQRLAAIKDKGFIDSLQFMAGGQRLKTAPHPQYIDIIKVYLPQPLESGKKITITTPFYTKLATYNSRSGHDGQSYMVCQWYPKPAVYDKQGWHEMAYLDQGEFYNDFGNYDVSLTTPAAYIIGATGVLQNSDEAAQYKAMGKANVAAKSMTNQVAYKPSGATKTLRYKAEKVSDFAWFADKDFVVSYDTLQLPSHTVDVFTYHHPDGNKNWVSSASYAKEGARHYSSYISDYPFQVVQAVEGPKNDMSGGMEYPMITLITSPQADEEMLDGVITHEVGHNWFPMTLGTNEREHTWLDEGLNTYFQFRYEAERYRTNDLFGSQIPKNVKEKPVKEFQDIIYSALRNVPMNAAIATPAVEFTNKEEYGLVEYIKTAVWLHYIEGEFGREAMDKAFHDYFNEWKFKHPTPEDFKASLEKSLGKDLTPYFDLLKQKGNI